MKKKVIRKTDFGLLKFKDMTAITSKTVADALGVRHSNLIKSVKKAEKYEKEMCSNHSTSNSNFNPIFKDYIYQDSNNRTQNCKLMNEDAVKVLIKVVDTQEAFNYFVRLMSEFNDMKQERNLRKGVVNSTKRLNDVLSILAAQITIETPDSSKPKMIYIHFQSAVNGVIKGKNCKLDRESLNQAELQEMKDIENLLADGIEKGLEDKTTATSIRETNLELLRIMKKQVA